MAQRAKRRGYQVKPDPPRVREKFILEPTKPNMVESVESHRNGCFSLARLA